MGLQIRRKLSSLGPLLACRRPKSDWLLADGTLPQARTRAWKVRLNFSTFGATTKAQ